MAFSLAEKNLSEILFNLLILEVKVLEIKNGASICFNLEKHLTLSSIQAMVFILIVSVVGAYFSFISQ